MNEPKLGATGGAGRSDVTMDLSPHSPLSAPRCCGRDVDREETGEQIRTEVAKRKPLRAQRLRKSNEGARREAGEAMAARRAHCRQ
jgi:hypothetical protein